MSVTAEKLVGDANSKVVNASRYGSFTRLWDEVDDILYISLVTDFYFGK
jgi:hypothetical protein